jgi:polyhydroxyalkanoate synthase
MFIDLESAFKNFEYYCHLYNEYEHVSSSREQLKSKIIISNDVYELEYYLNSPVNDRVFLLVPSLINSADIFLIGGVNSFVGYLSKLGRVYLINWREPREPSIDFNLNNYASEATNIAQLLHDEWGEKIDLVGYCLGGNLAIASAALLGERVKSLLLFATPWDFSYLQALRSLLKTLQIERAIETVSTVPITYMQILFFLMNLEKSFNKFFHDFDISQNENLETYFAVEKWLYNGRDISKPSYSQLMIEFIEKNVTMENKWYIGDQCINPTELKIPVLSVLGLRDKIVAANAVRAIYSKLMNCKSIEIDSGHIGFFVGRHRDRLYKEIDNWLRGVNE